METRRNYLGKIIAAGALGLPAHADESAVRRLAEETLQASLDLGAKKYQWNGDDFKSTYVVGRRPELYREIGLK